MQSLSISVRKALHTVEWNEIKALNKVTAIQKSDSKTKSLYLTVSMERRGNVNKKT